jgi:uncharacterized protein (DUF58 family)
MSPTRTTPRDSALPGARLLDPAVLARIDDLELVARVVVEGFLNGLHRAPHLGTSMDFAEHRAYAPGDDIRRIDWKLFARSDRFHVKEFEADTNTNCVVLLDVSRSMRFGHAHGPKLDWAKRLAACVLYLARRQRDRVGLATFDDAVVEWVPPSAKHLEIALHTLERAEAGRPGALAAPLRTLAEGFRRRSMVVLVSDLYEEPAAVADAAAHLRGKGNDLLVFHLLDPAELEFPYDEATTFVDLESGERIPVVPAKLRDRYRSLVAAHVAALTDALGGAGADYVLLDTGRPLEDALSSYLASRRLVGRAR